MKKTITIPEAEYQNTRGGKGKWQYWETTVEVLRWEHDFENHVYNITYKE